MDSGVRRPAWAGFTLIEVIVALAVLLILAAVAVPQIAGYLDQKRIEQAASQLAIVRDALFKGGGGSVAFRQTVGANAGRLSHLINQITNSDRDSCGGIYAKGEIGSWDGNAPYVNFIIDPAAGMATAIGLANDQLVRVPATAGAGLNRLRINWTNASLDDAVALDGYVDGTTGGWNAGTVQWTPQAGTNGLVTLYYDVVIDATC